MQISNLYFALQSIKKLQQIDRGLELAKAVDPPKSLPWLGQVHPRQLFEEKSSQSSANRIGFIPCKRARISFGKNEVPEPTTKKLLVHAVSQNIDTDSKLESSFAHPEPLHQNSFALEHSKSACMTYLTPKKEFTTGSYLKSYMSNSR